MTDFSAKSVQYDYNHLSIISNVQNALLVTKNSPD